MAHAIAGVQLPLENVEFTIEQYLLNHGPRLDTETLRRVGLTRAEELARGEWELEVATHVLKISPTYAEVASGELLALVNSYGHLEIAVRNGDARRALNLEPNTAITIRRRS